MTYIVAEIGNNHNGSLSQAKKLVSMAARSGVDAVKFQSFRGIDISTPKLKVSDYKGWEAIGFEYWYEFADSVSLPLEEHQEIIDFTHEFGIDFITTPVSPYIVEYLEGLSGIDAYKVASMDLNNDGLLRAIAKTDKPVIMSTGMGRLIEVDKAVDMLGNRDIDILHCVSNYPLQAEDAYLNNIGILRNRFADKRIGFSDHSLGHELVIVAVAMGAKIIEKHVTLDRNDPSPAEHHFSMEPNELTSMVQWIRALEKNFQVTEWGRSQKENQDGRQLYRRSFHYNKKLSAGHKVSADDLEFLRPGFGIGYCDLDKVVGQPLVCDVDEYQPCELVHV
ncbi:MAG: N,N'-diacetyllegionaminic acid synthase [Cellvibrionales bacterium UBA7375]|nr:MAG: N,N'-diacetyllegionaminic acid synthase [Cellvibrionales bacterium UBA7375]